MNRLLFSILTVLLMARSSAVAVPCDAIVSLAPSLTEVVFDLGLGSRLVGVTRYCRFPPQAQTIAPIGGFYDISLEKIVTLRPTMVLGLRENKEILDGARRFGIATREVDHTTVEGIKKSILTIAETCEVASLGAEKVATLERRERDLKASMRGVPPYRTLVAVGRTREGSSVSGVYVSGKDGFYSGILEILGLINVNQDSTVAIPAVSPEGFMSLAPDVIVEILSDDDLSDSADPGALWRGYPKIPAVRNNRVFTLREDYASIPGPRYIILAEDLARKIQGGDVK